MPKKSKISKANPFSSELDSLKRATDSWCRALTEAGHKHMGESFLSSVRSLEKSFENPSAEYRFQRLLDFKNQFNGGMGSVNDVYSGLKERQAVENERDLLLERYSRQVYKK